MINNIGDLEIIRGVGSHLLSDKINCLIVGQDRCMLDKSLSDGNLTAIKLDALVEADFYYIVSLGLHGHELRSSGVLGLTELPDGRLRGLERERDLLPILKRPAVVVSLRLLIVENGAAPHVGSVLRHADGPV